MKTFVIKTLEALAVIAFFMFILGGAVIGWRQAMWAAHFGYGGFGGVGLGALLGALIGFLVAVVVLGLVFLIMDIADNSRRTREILEAQAAKHGA